MFQKEYIGKGRTITGKVNGKNKNLQIVKVTLPFKGLEDLTFEKDGIRYLTFEVAKLKEPDKFGRTHTAYVSQLVPEKEPAQTNEPKPARKRKTRK